jgi:hypothetical protein
MGRLFLSVPGFMVRLRIDHMFGFGLVFEHVIDYLSNMRANAMRGRTPEGTDMNDNKAVLNAWDLEDLVLWEQLMTAPAAPQRRSRPAERSRRRPAGPRRPCGAPLRHGGTGVALSRARGPHRRRPITPATTVGLAVLAALITVWLGLVAQFGDSVRGASAPLPDRLAVVQVQAGESLQHVAARVAPDAPVSRVVERIRELNQLDTPSLDAGQTLIAPVA